MSYAPTSYCTVALEKKKEKKDSTHKSLYLHSLSGQLSQKKSDEDSHFDGNFQWYTMADAQILIAFL